MLPTISRQAEAYKSIYHGRTIVLKVSGAEIDSPDFSRLTEDVRWLTASGIRVVMAFGGGDQISRHYGKERRKIDGVAVTTSGVLRRGVMPALEEIGGKLVTALPEGVLVGPKDVVCSPHPDPKFGLVGIPDDIALPDEQLSFVGFVGEHNGDRLNVNADDVARKIAQQYRDEIEDLIFLTKTGGVLRNDGEVVSLLTDSRMRKLIAGKTVGDITVTDGMLKKLAEVRMALEVVRKVVITKTAGLRDEIENWMGSGTLCIDDKRLESSRMRYIEGPIFDAVYAQYVEKGIFRQRSAEQIEELKTHHRMVRAGKSPLGGYSLVPRGEYTELSTVWAGTIKNGMGKILLDTAHTDAGRRKIYALSTNPDAIQTFEAHPLFESLGQLSGARATQAERVPAPLATYDTNSRDPHVFLAHKRKT